MVRLRRGAMLTRVSGLAVAVWLAGVIAGHAETLNDALVAAYLGNPDLEAARANQRATDELVPQALAGWRPSVFIDGSLQPTRQSRRRLPDVQH